MRAVAIRELKNRLSAYLREVAAGEVVLVTDRGRVIAELRRPTSELMRSATEVSLERLAADGALTIGLPQDPKAYRRPLTDAERQRIVSFYRSLRSADGMTHEDARRKVESEHAGDTLGDYLRDEILPLIR